MALKGCYRVKRFVEKPDRAAAQSYLDAGDYFWNGGIFMFRAKTYLDELQQFEPQIAAQCREAVAKGRRDLDFFRLDEAAFAESPSKSIDYAVMEHTEHAAVVPVDMGWSDVGSWQSLWEIAARDGSGNAQDGDVVALNVANCYLRSEGPLLAVVGMEDVVVVATQDAVLVTRRDATQDVKKVVEEIERSGRHHHRHHRQVFRPWGSYDSIDHRRAFSGEAHHRQSGRQAFAADASSSRGALGGRLRYGEGDLQRQGFSSERKRVRHSSRWAPSIAWRIREPFRFT